MIGGCMLHEQRQLSCFIISAWAMIKCIVFAETNMDTDCSCIWLVVTNWLCFSGNRCYWNSQARNTRFSCSSVQETYRWTPGEYCYWNSKQKCLWIAYRIASRNSNRILDSSCAWEVVKYFNNNRFVQSNMEWAFFQVAFREADFVYLPHAG